MSGGLEKVGGGMKMDILSVSTPSELIPYIFPACICICLIWLICSARNAHLPKHGTTEWIERKCSPDKFSVLQNVTTGKSLLFALACFVISFAAYMCLKNFKFGFDTVLAAVFLAIECTCAYLAAYFCFGRELPGFAAFFACLSLSLYSGTIGAAFIALYILFVVLSLDKPLFSIGSGIFIGIASYIAAGNAAFAVFGLLSADTAMCVSKKASHIVCFILFDILLAAGVYTGLCFALDEKFLIPQLQITMGTLSAFDIMAAVLAVIVFVFGVIYKNTAALVVFEGVLITLAAKITGLACSNTVISLLPVFFASVVSVRGKKRHKAAAFTLCIVLIAITALEIIKSGRYIDIMDLTGIFYK